MAFEDTIIVMFIFFLMFYIIYTRIKKQSLNDTYEELKEVVIKKE